MQSAPTKQDRAAQFCLKRKALNDQFFGWVKAQQGARPDECWADEARQFLVYVGELKEEYADVLSAPAEPVEKAAEALPRPFAAPAPAPVPAPALAQVASTPASAPSPFAAAPPVPAAPFSMPSPFGAPLAGGFAFSAAPAMSFGGGATPFSAVQPAAAAEAEEDEPERPPSPSVHKTSAEDDGERVLFESKCKLFFSGESNGWSTRGMGTLQLRRPLDASAGASARLILRNDNTGKAMLNAKLYSGMKLVIKEGKSICTSVFNVVAPAAPVGGAAEDSQAAAPAGGAAEDSQPAAKPEPLNKHVMTMLRFKTNEDASKLKQLMEECLPK